MKVFMIKSFLLAAVFMAFTGCDSALVSEVKNTEFEKGLTIADVFDEAAFCDSVSWSEVEYNEGEKLALMECTLNEESIVYKGFDILAYHFEKTKNNVEVYNSYYENDKEEIVERSAWEADLLMTAAASEILGRK